MEREVKKKEEFESMKTTELIDFLDSGNVFDTEYDIVYDVLGSREYFTYLQEQVTSHTEQLEKLNEEVKEGLSSLGSRIDNIDNLWNIQNKLEIIIDKLRNPSNKTHIWLDSETNYSGNISKGILNNLSINWTEIQKKR